MPLVTQRIARGLTPFFDPDLTPARRTRPEKIILGVRPGHRPTNKPPVRIFLGSERKQFRAERVFLWSVEKNRDPGRIYEIYLLKGMKGYISGFWITGFTNYRFAIPFFCDFNGRAIYNDVDQVWLTDPAELFDQKMGGAGFLSINDHDTSVMLIDCKRMAGVWNRDAVFNTTRKRIEARARNAGLWGAMSGRFNARDAEHEPGQSACVHFTTLHTQPWRPFPDAFVYDLNPTGRLWFDLENEADAEAFLPVSALRPSNGWPDVSLYLTSRRDGPELAALLGPRSEAIERVDHRRIRGLLELVPDSDLPWVLDRLFKSARELDVEVHEPIFIRRNRARRSLHFWTEQFRLAGRLNPDTRWHLDRRVGWRRRTVSGGPRPPGAVVLLSRRRTRPLSKAEALGTTLARQTGRELIRATLPSGPAGLMTLVTGRCGSRTTIRQAAVVVASGAFACRVVRRIARSATPAPGLVLIGRRAGSVPEHGGVVISMTHHQLPPHPNRITMLLGFGHDDAFQPPVSTGAWQKWMEAPRRAALLLGRHPGGQWPIEELQRLAERARDWADRRDASLLIVTTRSSSRAAAALRRVVDDQTDLFAWSEGDDQNPYGLALERSGALLVAGSSPGIVQDALISRKPVYLWPHRDQPTLAGRWASRIAHRAFKPSYNKRGSIRPQQGLTYICARLIERGWVVPPAGLETWQNLLVSRGLAAWIDSDAIPSVRYKPEVVPVCRTVRERLELAAAANSGDASRKRSAPKSGTKR